MSTTIPPPSSPLEVINCLSLALSPSPIERSNSLQALQSWSTLPGYYLYLTNIFTSREEEVGGVGVVNDQIRLQSLLQFKNGVDKYWRKMSNNAISQEEKAQIRPLLITNTMINEPNRVIAKNLAVTIGKLARLDYGVDWNDLPETLLTSLESSNNLLTLHRSLLYLHSTIKSLSSNRIPKGRLLMKKLTELVFNPLVRIHQSILTKSVQKLQTDGLVVVGGGVHQEIEEIECSLLSFKCLKFLTIYGDSNPASNQSIQNFFVSTLQTFDSLVSLRLQLILSSSSPSSREEEEEEEIPPRLILLTKHIISYLKLYRGLIQQNISIFDQMGISQPILETIWNFVQNACSTDQQDTDSNSSKIGESFNSLYPIKFLIPCLLVLKSCLSSWDGLTPLTIPLEFPKLLLQLLITKCLVLKKQELEKWWTDPEEFINDQEDSQGREEFELRSCSEFLIKSLIGGYKEELGKVLVGFLYNNDTTSSSSSSSETSTAAAGDLDGLLLKEAVYTAIGKSCTDLNGILDFESWLNQSLLPEALGTQESFRIIRRRISWLLGCLISEDLIQSKESKNLVYKLMTHLLSRNESTDEAIRLTCSKSLQKVLDSWDFDLPGFLPNLEMILEELIDLLTNCQGIETLMRLNETLGIVISRTGESITPFASKLSIVLNDLWLKTSTSTSTVGGGGETSQAHFQTSILVSLTRLSEALGGGDKSMGLHSQACKIIEFSIDPNKPSHVYLQEDALELWSTLLKRSSSISYEMFQLLPNLLSLLNQGTDVLPKILSIFESYLLLDSNPNKVLETTSLNFFSTVSNLLDGLRFEAVKIVLHSINMVFKTTSTTPEGVHQWVRALDESGCFQKMLEEISKPDTSTLIVTKYLCSIARIILSSSTEIFYQLLESTANRTGTSSDHLLSIILDQFIERLDNMSQAGQRKLVALALSELVVTRNRIVLEKLGDLISLWSGVLAQTEETDKGDSELYHQYEPTDVDYTSEVEYDYIETLETVRKTNLNSIDPVITNKLSNFIGQRLQQTQELNGGVEIFTQQWLNSIDPIVLEELVKRLKGELKG
ncbi:hypothetical protein JCM3765_004618 [Sporobolomyces pararoseus]